MKPEGWMEKSVNNKPVLLYYEVLGFQEETMAHLDRHFNVKILPNPDSDTQEALQDAVVIFAPMGFVFGGEKINQCPRLQIIGSPTTGLVHIAVDYARERNISICSLKDQQDFLSSITPTAELAWGLILSVVRKIPWAYESVCQGKWNGKEFGKRTPKMMSNMRLGVVGLGRLGSWVAKYGKAFKMDVFYFDPYVKDGRYVRCTTLLELAKVSDIVSVHVHLSEETENLIDNGFFQALPEGAFVVNTARGGIVNESALLEALNSGRLGGAGLDMLAGEHLPEFGERLVDHPLGQYARTHDNLVLTPKMGGATVDAWAMTERRVVDLILQELKRRG
jgi:lactate dehydrogenase-like 2-hydroxyacid dehydrogenase